MRLFVLAALAAAFMTGTATAATMLPLTITSSTDSTVTFSWAPPATVSGYTFWAAGSRVSNTQDGARSTVRFGRVGCDGQPGCYEVRAQTVLATGSSSGREAQGTPAPANFRVAAATQTTVTVAWDAVAGTTNYRLYRDGTLIGQGAGSNGGWADTWEDVGLACETTHVYGIDAQGPEGTSETATLSASTTDCSTPPPPIGDAVELSGTVSASAFLAAVNAAPAGVVTVRPVSGQSSFTVTGNLTLSRRNVTVQHGAFTGTVTFPEEGSGATFEDGALHEFEIYGGDDISILRNIADGKNTSCLNNQIFASPAGHVPERFKLVGNTFRNYFCGTDPSTHTEALYIGYSQDGRIEGNTFDNNGSTGHIFFTYWAVGQDPATTWPRNMCVTGNTFLHVVNPYYAIQGREEIGGSANISIAPSNTFTDVPSPNGSPKVLAGGFSFNTKAC